jgi:hypothetical protein
MSNIDEFNMAVAMILDRLYKSFPAPVVIHVEELDSGADEHLLDVYASTVKFLLDEGFIRGDKSIREYKSTPNVVLTTKGLAVLNSVPDPLQERTPLGQRVSGALKSGTKEAINAVISQVIAAAFIAQTGGR